MGNGRGRHGEARGGPPPPCHVGTSPGPLLAILPRTCPDWYAGSRSSCVLAKFVVRLDSMFVLFLTSCCPLLLSTIPIRQCV